MFVIVLWRDDVVWLHAGLGICTGSCIEFCFESGASDMAVGGIGHY